MRSRASHARALFRLVTTQSSSSSSAAAPSATTGSTSSASSSSAVASSASPIARAARPAIASRRRRNSTSSRNLAARNEKKEHQTIFIKTDQPPSSPSNVPQSVVPGIEAVQPPTAMLSRVMWQAFFAGHKPLLEHQTVPKTSSLSSSAGSGSNFAADASEQPSGMQATINGIRDALMEAASQASHMTPDALSRTTFVIGKASNTGDLSEEESPLWPKGVSGLDPSRFNKLIDTLSKPNAGRKAIETEAKLLAEEEEHRDDIKEAVMDAAERGEDTSLAEKLGSEAELVIVGQPNGPDPKWPRGVATFLAENTRPLEPPDAPSEIGKREIVQAMEKMEIEDLARHFAGSANSFTVQNVSENDVNLLFSHAMVQAVLPSRMQWDGVVAKMDAAAEVESTQAAVSVDVTTLNADPLLTAAEQTGDTVHMDSVKRKRRKKMRKHKYRKFRKATRTERNRLKK